MLEKSKLVVTTAYKAATGKSGCDGSARATQGEPEDSDARQWSDEYLGRAEVARPMVASTIPLRTNEWRTQLRGMESGKGIRWCATSMCIIAFMGMKIHFKTENPSID